MSSLLNNPYHDFVYHPLITTTDEQKQNSQDMTNGECYAARVDTPVKLSTGALQHKDCKLKE